MKLTLTNISRVRPDCEVIESNLPWTILKEKIYFLKPRTEFVVDFTRTVIFLLFVRILQKNKNKRK